MTSCPWALGTMAHKPLAHRTKGAWALGPRGLGPWALYLHMDTWSLAHMGPGLGDIDSWAYGPTAYGKGPWAHRPLGHLFGLGLGPIINFGSRALYLGQGPWPFNLGACALHRQFDQLADHRQPTDRASAHKVRAFLRLAPIAIIARCTLTARSTLVCAERSRFAPRLRRPFGSGESWLEGDPRGDARNLFFGETLSMSCPRTNPGARSSSHPFIAFSAGIFSLQATRQEKRANFLRSSSAKVAQTNTKIAFWYFSHYKYYIFKIL